MITEKETIRCEAVFNEDRTHRVLWKRVWNKDKPLAMVLMLNPSQADSLVSDMTTFLVVNNVTRLEKYGGVVISNLFSQLTPKLNFRWHPDEELNCPENDTYIRKAAEECEIIILGWGKGVKDNQRVLDRIEMVKKLLSDCKEKFAVISDGENRGMHPLTPSIRSQWVLEPYEEEPCGNPEE